MMTAHRWVAAVVLLSVGVFIPGLASGAPDAPDTTVVTGIQESLGQHDRTVDTNRPVEGLLEGSPFQLIGRGAGAISDLYVDGFKRGDINVTIDGERFTTACPNRMDTRIGQIDLSEMEAVHMSRNSSQMQEGLGGQLDFRRRLPGEKRIILGRYLGALNHGRESDLSLSWEQDGRRLGGRHRSFAPYLDAEGRTFDEAYGYNGAPNTLIYGARAHLRHAEGDAYFEYERSEDVLFPYLLMDERSNDLFEASGSWRGHRVYLNHVNHVMDNALRSSYAMTDMVTEARNTMFGVVGDRFEFYARHWDADNRITPRANPAMEKLNTMLPDVWRFGATVQHQVGAARPWLHLRLGAVHTRVGEDAVEDLYRILEPEAGLSRWSVPFGVRLTHHLQVLPRARVGVSAELASDAPGVEQLTIATDKPGTKPDWVGNPELDDPLRATARLAVQGGILHWEVFLTRVWNYPYLVKRSVQGAMYQTYAGVDAILAGSNLFAAWNGLEGGASWNWGEKTEDDSPLAEIQPLTLFAAYTTPVIPGGMTGRVGFRHSLEQSRIDGTLDEAATDAWSRLDVALRVKGDEVDLEIGFDNVTNEMYSRHLSYLRNPFASGVRVHEPGRTFRAAVTYRY